jgi:pSer/pThr/pTyr-binding forkhead associated (FHA) protein
MKVTLFVTQGNAQGKSIPINIPIFVIGRDPKCHLRPASSMISKRHCALQSKDGKVFIQDFESTNGTFVNEEKVTGERELKNKDMLKVGPLVFEVRIDTPTPVDKPTPLPESKVGAKAAPPKPAATGPKGEEDAIADMLLDTQDDGAGVDLGASEEPDQGSTILDMEAAKKAEAEAPKIDPKIDPKTGAPRKAMLPASAKSETQNAAEAILAKMSRRRK